MRTDTALYYELIETFLDPPYPTLDEIRSFEAIWDDMDGYAGIETHKMTLDLRDRGFTKDQIRAFGVFYICTGITEGWLLDELGF